MDIAIFGIPCVVAAEDDRKNFICTDGIIHMYGIGDCKEEAVEDYKQTVIEYLDELRSDSDRLVSYLAGHLEDLESKVN